MTKKTLVAPFAIITCSNCHGTAWYMETKEFVALKDSKRWYCSKCKKTVKKADLLQ